ncbi:MAG TPA: hypothetical protein VHB48_07950 [Chitinophagaceae bacterium]|jgi:hypothetical protein|nr:hypothetical protein [Chitinophagaceae bacterium]
MKKTTFVMLLCCAVCCMAKAQDMETSNALGLSGAAGLQSPALPGGIMWARKNKGNIVIPGFTHKKAFTIFAGTAGVGADFRYGILPRLSARIGAGVTPVNVPNAFKINTFNSNIDLNVNFTNVHLIADLQPFAGSGFRIAVGAGYFMKAKTIADITPGDNISFGNISFTPDEFGSMKITADWKGIAPYLGLGFFRAFPSNLFNINLDLGTYYLTAPQTTIIATKALAPNEDNSAQLQQNLSTYRWLPVLQLNFSFRF